MKKRTAIIDIGSNSARLVIYEQTSLFGFHLICEQKSKVRIGEGAYEKEGYLQPVGIKRAFLALKSFRETIHKYKAQETYCVATSALRDAPNACIFIQWIKDELDIEIQVIEGKSEAKYGGIAVVNLLPVTDGISIDIGGGSSDISLIEKGKIVDMYSLDIGTVRLKELFFDKQLPISEAKRYIHKALNKLPAHFKHPFAIGIGGTARTLSRAIMRQSHYPLDKLHAFTYDTLEQRSFFEAVYTSSAKNLKRFEIESHRYDTIREGTLIFDEILKHLKAQKIITSSAGVREGVFLSKMLNQRTVKFPPAYNPSIESILNRFKPMVNVEKKKKAKLAIGKLLYQTILTEIPMGKTYMEELRYALKLSSIGKTLTLYKSHKHAFYIAMQELNYGFTHEQMVLISLLLRSGSDSTSPRTLFKEYQSLLPEKNIFDWLSFIYRLTVLIHEASNSAKIDFSFSNKTLVIYSDKSLYLAKEKIRALKKPIPFAIIIADETNIPINNELGIVDSR